MFQNLHFRLSPVSQIQLSKKSLLLFFLLSFFGNSTFAQASGNTIDFDGTNDYVSLGTTFSFPNTTAFTIEACVSRKIGSGVMVVSKQNGGVEVQCYFMVNTDETVSFSSEVAPLWLKTTTTTGFTDNWIAPSLSTSTNYILSI